MENSTKEPTRTQAEGGKVRTSGRKKGKEMTKFKCASNDHTFDRRGGRMCLECRQYIPEQTAWSKMTDDQKVESAEAEVVEMIQRQARRLEFWEALAHNVGIGFCRTCMVDAGAAVFFGDLSLFKNHVKATHSA